MHITDQGRSKFDPRYKKCTFISYDEDEFGYRIWDDENKKVIHSKDVIFNERVMYKEIIKPTPATQSRVGQYLQMQMMS